MELTGKHIRYIIIRMEKLRLRPSPLKILWLNRRSGQQKAIGMNQIMAQIASWSVKTNLMALRVKTLKELLANQTIFIL